MSTTKKRKKRARLPPHGWRCGICRKRGARPFFTYFVDWHDGERRRNDELCKQCEQSVRDAIGRHLSRRAGFLAEKRLAKVVRIR